MTHSPEVAAAEAKAKSSSFYAGMRVLPEAERTAMFAIYAFCRAVDDIVDEPGIEPGRADLADLYEGGAGGRTAFLKPAVERFGLLQADFLAVIDGMQMDADADIRAPGFATLDLYCDRVASAVGRLSVRVFGMDADPGEALAYHLGRALQLTNIIRDIDEDAGIGRLYLAREWLDAAGIAGDDPMAVVADPRVDAAARQGAALAQRHYAEADKVMAARPKGRLVAPRLMSGVYGAILKRMEQEGWAPPRTRVKLGKGELMAIVARRLVLGR
jgi:presqualene diphosphate synthase